MYDIPVDHAKRNPRAAGHDPGSGALPAAYTAPDAGRNSVKSMGARAF